MSTIDRPIFPAIPDRTVTEGELLWTPSADFANHSPLGQFIAWLDAERGLRFADYAALWRWSVSDDAFWRALWDFFAVESSTPYSAVRAGEMPKTRWFIGSRVNFAEHLLRHERRAAPGEVAIVHSSEIRPRAEMSWQELGTAVRTAATWLRSQGIVPGDRIVSYMPNIPETAIAMLAVTAVGAVWSSAAPEFGPHTVLDRFAQIEPKLIFAVDGYRYGGVDVDRRPEVRTIIAGLPTLERVIWLPYLDAGSTAPTTLPVTTWADMVGGTPVDAASFTFERVAEDHPLWILFTSGTTGLPKPIVHGHTGVTIESFKNTAFCHHLKPGSRLFFYSTTGWVVWNLLVSGLMQGASIVLYDGSPVHPSPDVLWKMAAESRATTFGTSPTFLRQMQAAGIVPRLSYDLSALVAVSLTGAPGTPESMAWVYDNVKSDLWVMLQSGATDFAAGVLGSVSTQPVYAGEIQARLLGMDVHAWNGAGQEVIDEVGEMVMTSPCPSMPLYFWNDPDDVRYRESYFSSYPGVWRHGDFIRINGRGGAFVLGRSDATLNRHGVRIGTAEIYRCLERIDDVADSMAVCVDSPSGETGLLLFVKLKAGVELDDELRMRIARRLRDECSTRHVPDDIHAVPDIPYTLTAKKMEVPVMRILNGAPAAAVADTDAMRNPAAIGWFVEFRAASVRGARVAGTTVEPEAAVASAWRQALGRHSLQSDAPFDELGGDSLRELKLVFHLESELGCKIPLDIFRPSMRRSEFTAALERYLAGGLRRSQTAPTVMLLPGRAGDTPALADFRMSFGSDLNVALLDYPDWTDLVDPVDPFGSFVHAMVERIERAAPVGPLRLAGYSLGGALLYSVARELIARGRRIDALAVIDARFGLTPKLGPADPATKQTLARPVSTHDALPIAFARRVARPFGREILQPVLRALIPLRRVPLPFGLTWYLHAEISDIVRVALVDRWWRALTPPVPPLSTPLTVFCSQERVAGEPADYGWSRACADVTVVNVPGMHESMLDPENRELLCAEFLALMTRPRVPEEALAAAGR